MTRAEVQVGGSPSLTVELDGVPSVDVVVGAVESVAVASMASLPIAVTVAPLSDLQVGVIGQREGVPVAVSPPQVFQVSVGDKAGPPGAPGRDGAAPTPYPFTAAATWTVRHGLGRFVDVSLLDETGAQFDGDVEQPDLYTVVVTHAIPITGTAVVL